ncbi:hypothetical protein KJ940_09145 [Myxococcota bacterium]|nr:hypothetical protein [Myxococcota bacterium]
MRLQDFNVKRLNQRFSERFHEFHYSPLMEIEYKYKIIYFLRMNMLIFSILLGLTNISFAEYQDSPLICPIEAHKSLCFEKSSILKEIWPKGKLIKNQIRIDKQKIANIVAFHSVRIEFFENLMGLIIIEIFEAPIGQTEKMSCHACLPSMAMALVERKDNKWILVSSGIDLDASGEFSELACAHNMKFIHFGQGRLIFKCESSYTAQGSSEFYADFYSNLDKNRKTSKKIIKLGPISMGYDNCGFNEDQDYTNIVLNTVYRGHDWPNFIAIPTSGSCKKNSLPITGKIETYSIDNKTLSYKKITL